jgi:hypothetical protein
METIVKAKNKIEALKIAGYDNIYFQGNMPYSMEYSIYTYKITAHKIEDGYLIIKGRVIYINK